MSLVAAFIRAMRAAAAVIRGRVVFRSCESVGFLARASFGRPDLVNRGTIRLGSRVWLASSYAAVRLETYPGGSLTIGDRTGVNYGASITAGESITIGKDVSVAPYCVITDREPGLGGAAHTEPVEIGDGCWLATRVVVSPGSRIGANSVITAGTHVRGVVEPDVVYGGAPPRVLRRLGLAASPSDADGPVSAADRPEWTTGLKSSDATVAATHPAPRPTASRRALLVADHTIDALADFLDPPKSDFSSHPRVAAEIAPFDQTVPTLLSTPPEGDLAVVWTQPDVALPAMRRLLDGEPVTREALETDVDAFAALLTQTARKFNAVFVPTWVLRAFDRGRGLVDCQSGGQAWALGVVNARLMTALERVPSVFVLDAQRWLATTAGGTFSEQLWFEGKILFTDSVMKIAATEVRAAVASLSGSARKLIALDLDDTLWGGIIGDVGSEGLQLGGHDARGEAYQAFQRELLRLKHRGILLALVSKNDEEVAVAAIDGHPEMVLRTADLVGWRIDWNDKAQNIIDLSRELNLGLQSIVFIDDNPRERSRVREALPEVLVPEWPVNPVDYRRALAALACFDQPATTSEDLNRTEMYTAERTRKQALGAASSVDEWLDGLQIAVTVEPLSERNLKRAAQLLNKTNQMNLSTRRLSEEEFLAWSRGDDRRSLTVTVADRLGQSGLTGLVSVEVDGSIARIVDFVLSCRVMGRRIEEVMLSLAADAGQELGADRLMATVRPTSKNGPCQRFFASSAMSQTGHGQYELDLHQGLEFPQAIELVA